MEVKPMSHGYWTPTKRRDSVASTKKVVKKVPAKEANPKKAVAKKQVEAPARKRRVLRMAKIAKKYRSPRKR